jgi:photosystem II stability/assembly factor-like uncharacterized protein
MKKTIIVLLLLAYQFSYSQWELLYPTVPNTTISSFAVSGSNVFAGSTTRGIYLSTDKGQNWTNKRIGFDIKPVKVNSIAISGNNVFVATADSGVYRSDNLGDSWEKIINGLLLLNENSVSANGNNVFAGTNGAGIFFSSDNGNNWVARNNGINNLIINTIAIDGNNIFIGTKGGGIYFSTNVGENWIAKNSGLENKADSTIHSIDIEGKNVLAGTGNGIFLSTDLGQNWVRKYPNGEAVSAILNGSYIYAIISTIILKSTDMGNEWKINYDNGLVINYTNNGTKYSTNIIAKSLALIEDNIVLAGTASNGLYISTNGGEFFEAKALVDYNIKSIVTSGENMFVSSYSSNAFQDYGGGLYKSINNGNSWSRIGFQGQGIWSMVIKADSLFALHYYDGLYYSTDLGDTWKVKDTNSFPKDAGLRSLVINGNNWAIATVTSGVIISTDSGNSWQIKNESLAEGAIYSISLSGNNIFAGSGGGKGIYLSTNLGDSWVEKGLSGLYVYSIEISGNYIFAGTNNGFYSSSDFGETWVLKFKDNISTSTLVFELYDGNLIIGVSGNNAENKVFVSTDMGESWFENDTTIAGSDTPFRNPGYSVQDFAVSGEYIYAVVSPGSLIFKAKLSNLIPTDVRDEESEIGTILFPNPATDFITIQFKPSEGSDIRIFDMLGERTFNPTPALAASREGVRIDVSFLAPGMYFIKIGNKVEKFVKI